MLNPESLVHTIQRNRRVIALQVKGLTHEDSLLQPPFRGNCLNWVLGHIVSGRCSIMELLGLEPIWDEHTRSLYRSESNPIVNASQLHLQLEELLEAMDAAQEAIVDKLHTMSLEEVTGINGDNSEHLGSLEGLVWHESYHIGQTEFLRQLSGVNDKVI